MVELERLKVITTSKGFGQWRVTDFYMRQAKTDTPLYYSLVKIVIFMHKKIRETQRLFF